MPSFLNRLESPEGLRTLSTACYIGAAVPLALFFLMGHEWYPWHIRFPLISMLGAALLGFIVLRFLGKAAATYPAAEVTGERRRALLAPIACGLFVGLAVMSRQTSGLLTVLFVAAAALCLVTAIYYAYRTSVMAKKQGYVKARNESHAASR